MNGIVNVLWKYGCGVATGWGGGVRGISGCGQHSLIIIGPGVVHVELTFINCRCDIIYVSHGGGNIHAATFQTNRTKRSPLPHATENANRDSKMVTHCLLHETGRKFTKAIVWINAKKHHLCDIHPQANDVVPREEIWRCTRECNVGLPEKYVKLMQDIEPRLCLQRRCALCRRRKQHIQRGCEVASTICIEQIPVPHTHRL